VPRRIITAREQFELLAPWREAATPPELNSSNPTGSLFVDYDPHSRTGPLGSGVTTLDKAKGVHPDDPVTIYRGAPHHQKSIAPGDFVTTDPQLAHDYAPTGHVLQTQVGHGDVVTDPDEWEGGEHIYRPRTASWDDYGDDDDYARRRAEEDSMWDDHEPYHPPEQNTPEEDEEDDQQYLHPSAEAELAHAKNTDWNTYANLIPPPDRGARGPRPPLTMQPVQQLDTNGIMARHSDDNRPVGHLMWHPDGEIATVNVHPDFQGTGIADAMLHHARSNPDLYKSTGPIHHSRDLTEAGEKFARRDPHHTMPPDQEIKRATNHNSPYKTYTGHNYVPASVPYNGPEGQAEEAHMQKGMGGKPFTMPMSTPWKPQPPQNVKPGMGYGYG